MCYGLISMGDSKKLLYECIWLVDKELREIHGFVDKFVSYLVESKNNNIDS
jgi:hypothetical protein